MRLSCRPIRRAALALARGDMTMNNNSNFLYFHKFWLALGWVWIANVTYLSLIPEPPGPDGPGWDKVGHYVYCRIMLITNSRERVLPMILRRWRARERNIIRVF